MLWKKIFGKSVATPASRLLAQRQFHSSAARSNDWFGSMTENKDNISKDLEKAKANKQQSEEDLEESRGKMPSFKNDSKLQEFIAQQKGESEVGIQKYGTGLKQQLWDAYQAQHNGYDKTKKVTLDGREYQMILSPNEIKAFEPSVYCKSYRIDGTWKKAQLLLRMLRKMNVHEAITQCQFSAKRMGRPVAELLQRGVSAAKDMNIDPEGLYIDEIWVGSDPRKFRFVDPKGRGRAGMKHAEYIHIRAILRTPVTQKREALEKEYKRQAKKPVFQHETRKVGDGYLKSDYRW
ncbi:54S ribosomal protein L22 [Yarrowia sp. B02]|nr:54S ribosomal protein L22 [Yarrowia sp. B02]